MSFPAATELTRVGISDFFIPRQRKLIDSVGLPRMAREGRWEQELRFRDWYDSAHEIDVRCSMFGLYDENKRFVAGVTITQEISTRLKAERIVRDGRAMVDELLEKLPIDVGVFDATGRLVYSNDGWRSRGVYSLPVRRQWKGVTQRSGQPTPQDLGSHALHGEQGAPADVMSTDPRPNWIRVSAFPLGGSDSPTGAAVFVQDIDELKRTRAQATRHEAWLSVAAEVAAFGIFSFEPESALFHWDARARQIWGLDPDQAVDWQVFQGSIHEQDAARVLAVIGDCMSAGRPQQLTLDYRITRHDDRSVRRVRTTLRSMFDAAAMTALVGASIEVKDPTPG